MNQTQPEGDTEYSIDEGSIRGSDFDEVEISITTAEGEEIDFRADNVVVNGAAVDFVTGKMDISGATISVENHELAVDVEVNFSE